MAREAIKLQIFTLLIKALTEKNSLKRNIILKMISDLVAIL